MAIPAQYIATLQQERFYHIVCKSLHNQKLFLSDENRFFFLKRYKKFLHPFLSTYAYCLLDNHAHFIIRIHEVEDIIDHITQIKPEELTINEKKILSDRSAVKIDQLLERQFNSFFVSYTRSFNIYYKRKGHLFDSPFKRILLSDEAHITQAIVYVHANAQRHKLVSNFYDYKWSSYHSILGTGATHLNRQDVLNWFGGREGFVETHERQSNYYYAE
jgi:putative transposase